MKNLLTCIFVCFILINLIPTTLATETSYNSGFRTGKVFGIFPSVSGDEITFIMLAAPFGKITIDKTRFDGHSGIFLIFGEYQWFEDGPPALLKIV